MLATSTNARGAGARYSTGPSQQIKSQNAYATRPGRVIKNQQR
jgi:hypothetical protein